MPSTRPSRPIARPRVVSPRTGEVTAQGMRQLADTVQRTADQISDRAVLAVDLIVGANVLDHELGRVPAGATVSPTVADATWAWAVTSRDDRQLTITCVGVAQPSASVEVY